jgi:23S rRNA pseudouridine2605 synthase
MVNSMYLCPMQKPERKSKKIRTPKAGSRQRQKPAREGEKKQVQEKGDDFIRLNKFISNAGVCSRREADILIQTGQIRVNGVIVTELGTKVKLHDQVYLNKQRIVAEKKQYVLLNKPKGFITSSSDPFDRKTVMMLVEKACSERIYPVGRLDRNTTGLLLFTNDGDLAKKLTHPKHGIRKLYHVVLNKALEKNDMLQLAEGVELEDGPAQLDKIAYVENANDKKQLGVELHSGKNRIIRRVFEKLGYEVVKLDRVGFAGLTKKDIPRGRFRHLKKHEINQLKMISA